MKIPFLSRLLEIKEEQLFYEKVKIGLLGIIAHKNNKESFIEFKQLIKKDFPERKMIEF